MIERAGLRLPYISGLLHDLKRYDGVPIEGLPLTGGGGEAPVERQVTSLRSGYSTGACAAAAAKAAAEVLLGGAASPVVEVPFPDGTRVALATLYARMSGGGGEAA